MQTINHLNLLREAVAELRKSGRVALVPTMGALHFGHLTLMREARRHAEHVVASIFVNPRQFAPGEDLDAYPRQLAADKAALESEGVALLWAPTVDEMYPADFSTNVGVSGVSEGFCGAARPGHFDGVATVVLKLFNQVAPDVALFGEKDWQQLAVIRRMARDLDLTAPHVDAIIGVPTVREEDGLARSSRNAYLSAQERADAVALPRAMQAAAQAVAGGMAIGDALAQMEQAVLAGGFLSVDYAQICDADTLAPLTQRGTGPARLLAAARIGKARLIDNMDVPLG
ncbi:pantoate--beta-alanine ligase [Novosphingobium sediminicola]|uniref:Pantothenate synthetase n=1 Tax=Novosphingobium sediminicola TaxID=563162 RepID=A0A7W6G8W5_9SPHN|nr:pantoate--beta-alanine ligase [Novosphingobium sediminicola]